MDIRWLEDFLSLVDTRNFSRSAQLRFTTQPAFSRRIKSLEEWIGTPLFDRNKQPIALTRAGERFHDVAEDVLRQLFQVREELHHYDELETNTITFVATHGLSLSFFPGWICNIEQAIGPVMTRLDSRTTESCVQSLAKGQCQFMLCHMHWPRLHLNLPPSHFKCIKVGEDRLLPVAAPTPDGKPRYVLPGTRIKPVPYLAYGDTSAASCAVGSMLKLHPEPPHLERVFVAHLAAILASMARTGRGLAWLPESRIKEDLDTGCLVPAGSDEWIIPVEIGLFRSSAGLPPRCEELWSYLSATKQRQRSGAIKAKNAWV